MAALGYTHRLSDHEPERPFELLPSGKYLAQIIGSETKFAKSGGVYVNFKIEILEPEAHAKRILFDMVTIENQNEMAVDIGRHRLSSMADACFRQEIQDTEELHFIPVVIGVTIRKQEGYSDQNKISGYKRYEEGEKIAQVATASRTSAPSSRVTAAAPKTTKAEPLDDEIPF
jgi:hypothetical protein